MILCVCLNPALDITYRADELVHGASHRVDVLGVRGGGKGLNVARVLAQLGEPVILTGLLGGDNGKAIGRDLDVAGIASCFMPVVEQSRRSVTVVDGRDATVLNEPGPVVAESEWQDFLAWFDDVVQHCQVVALSGSLPPGVPPDAYELLTRQARRSGAKVLVDAGGDALRAVLPAGPDIVKPNVSELRQLLGRKLGNTPEILSGAQSLRAGGAGAAVVSRGALGVVALTPDGAFTARTLKPIQGNPTGAGDALAAVLARSLLCEQPWRATLVAGVAVSAAAVTVAVAGATDLAHADRLADDIEVEELPWP